MFDFFLYIFSACLPVVTYFLGYRAGTSTVKEYHYYHYEKNVEIPTDDKGRPIYNKSQPDPDYAEWYMENR